ncbi:hypothetical protein CCACVL1_19725 [Corchorus capsularis]|uniref:Uncharacterized protein n=1 Tax=Corchorus capsularis TaxID=210143 RepID=A0A1R3HF59_COCAP|nr:hypothetical protein CCACVL1_19725 [Corchorus capsularis]
MADGCAQLGIACVARSKEGFASNGKGYGNGWRFIFIFVQPINIGRDFGQRIGLAIVETKRNFLAYKALSKEF